MDERLAEDDAAVKQEDSEEELDGDVSAEARSEREVSDAEESEEQVNKITPLIDLEMIRKWRRTCHNTHGDICHERYSDLLAEHLDSLTLVDTHNDALVTLPTTTPYVALSYVWNNIETLKTQESNIEALKKSGALANAAKALPATIRDAIHLVKSLGERYLWVDCLSVKQNQKNGDMDTILRAMAYIYASAKFTIVDAGGSDADHGLRGVGGSSQPRQPWILLDGLH